MSRVNQKTPLFVCGIGTGVGKTVVSAILCEALGADYWKPIQAGDLDHSDRIRVHSLVGNSMCRIHEEAYRLPYPLSPHASAAMAGIEIDINHLNLPITDNRLVIEGAGGLLVPLTNNLLYIDVIQAMDVEVVLVSRHYLGSINHTLLSAECLKNRDIPVKGIIFNGNENIYSEEIILSKTGFTMLGRITDSEVINRDFVKLESQKFEQL